MRPRTQDVGNAINVAHIRWQQFQPRRRYFNAYAWSARVPLDPLFNKRINFTALRLDRPRRPAADASADSLPPYIFDTWGQTPACRRPSGRAGYQRALRQYEMRSPSCIFRVPDADVI